MKEKSEIGFWARVLLWAPAMLLVVLCVCCFWESIKEPEEL